MKERIDAEKSLRIVIFITHLIYIEKDIANYFRAFHLIQKKTVIVKSHTRDGGIRKIYDRTRAMSRLRNLENIAGVDFPTLTVPTLCLNSGKQHRNCTPKGIPHTVRLMIPGNKRLPRNQHHYVSTSNIEVSEGRIVKTTFRVNVTDLSILKNIGKILPLNDFLIVFPA